jgi:hypothetical protein
MNIGGLNTSAGDAAQAALEQARARIAEQRPSGNDATSGVTARPTVVRQPATTPSVLSVQAPPGTDPALWNVLTTEERSFFAKATTTGPLTYSRIAARGNPDAQALPVLRGVRIDVRA